jgi:hypothetical protein
MRFVSSRNSYYHVSACVSDEIDLFIVRIFTGRLTDSLPYAHTSLHKIRNAIRQSGSIQLRLLAGAGAGAGASNGCHLMCFERVLSQLVYNEQIFDSCVLTNYSRPPGP